VRHVVECAGEAGHFVVAVHRDAAGEIAAGDIARGPLEDDDATLDGLADKQHRGHAGSQGKAAKHKQQLEVMGREEHQPGGRQQVDRDQDEARAGSDDDLPTQQERRHEHAGQGGRPQATQARQRQGGCEHQQLVGGRPEQSARGEGGETSGSHEGEQRNAELTAAGHPSHR
jgi:hypothetical protein